MQDSQILSVSALTLAIKGTLEGAFPFVWVRGQVANLGRPSSGHLYFSLRDEDNSLAAVWFKGDQKNAERFDPLTGEVYEGGLRKSLSARLENGQEVICAGRISVYGSRGTYQLIVEFAQAAGMGHLHEEFERLRHHLATLGCFALERKRPLPACPGRVAVVTAPHGAAIHDFLRLSEGRGLAGVIRIFPALVQGDAAPASLTAAFARIRQEAWAEVIVLIRGGGSLEDLWAFNDEAVVQAVLSAPVPVLAGIGHEVDVTLADMAADVRAATPSHAAQLLWPERRELHRQLHTLSLVLEQAEARWQERTAERLDSLARVIDRSSPVRLIAAWQERLSAGERLLASACRLAIQRIETSYEACSTALYVVPRSLPAREQAVCGLAMQLHNAGEKSLAQTERDLEMLALRLGSVDPHAPLRRGYVLVRKGDGNFVRATQDVSIGEALHLVVSNGEIPVRVEGGVS